jgi:23S rRNA (cytidine1920-2'-O)/16S rRNA (cytidine1409-2'-O)-methyltransferase
LESGRKERLDQLVLERGFAATRAQAHALIRAGEVEVGGVRADKPGALFPRDADVRVRAKLPFVGRGGLKLAGALRAFGVEPRGLVVLDVGASTGGFTDALLQAGARKVYAVDVGYGQLAWPLRNDARVVCLERTDIRALPALPDVPDLAVVDVAFISLRLVLPAVHARLAPNGLCLALVKPQFEAGRAEVGKGGVVRSARVHRAVLEATAAWCLRNGWQVEGVVASAVAGGAGNREFFVRLRRQAATDRHAGATDELPASVAHMITAALGPEDGGDEEASNAGLPPGGLPR